ncbi:MAG: hypothetical protein F9K43_04665 [Bauldia sp.]|nr:MAG: hypothetical protein F9K43_04665 [Bauldia sp.]
MCGMRIVRLKPYLRAMRRMGFSANDIESVEADIVASWQIHPIVQGLRGVRKARIARPGTGKSGGARVIYYMSVGHGLLAMLTACAKSAQADLSSDDRKAILRAVSALTNGETK